VDIGLDEGSKYLSSLLRNIMSDRTGNIFQEQSTALHAPFAEVKWLNKGGRDLAYITARDVMNRLDEVIGPENWEDDYEPFGSDGVKCKLTVRFDDHTTVTKTGVGGAAEMKDGADNEASAESHAMKRAAVKFGIGRYLYGNGVPNYCGDTPRPQSPGGQARPQRAPAQQPARTAAQPQAAGRQNRAPNFNLPDPGRAYGWCKDMEQHFGPNILGLMTKAAKADGLPTDTRQWDEPTNTALCMRAVEYLKKQDNYKGEFDHLSSGVEESSESDDETPW
jgi:hypothetical protein